MKEKIYKRWVPVVIHDGDEYYITKRTHEYYVNQAFHGYGEKPGFDIRKGSWQASDMFRDTGEYLTLDLKSNIINYASKKRAKTAVVNFLSKAKNVKPKEKNQYGWNHFPNEENVKTIRAGLEKFMENTRIEFREIEFVETAVKFDPYAAKKSRIIVSGPRKKGQSKCAACGVKLRDIPYVTTNMKPANICVPCLIDVADEIKTQYDNMDQDMKDAIDAGKFMHKI